LKDRVPAIALKKSATIKKLCRSFLGDNNQPARGED
jgi:hypothetical protein